MDPKNEFGVKLRLRGKGSGFKEGPMNKESEDDLHLCVSSQFLDFGGMQFNNMFPLYNQKTMMAYDVFKYACENIEDLLLKIYRDYQIFTSEKFINGNSKKLPLSKTNKRNGNVESGVQLGIKKYENKPAAMMSQMYPCGMYYN